MSGTVRSKVPTREIVRVPHVQIRRKLDPATINRYAQAYRSGAELPPLKVARIGGRLVLFSGWHRLAALESEGIREADVEIVEAQESELPWLAAQENLAHGLPLKSPELRQAFRAYIKADRHVVGRRGRRVEYQSYREIGHALGKPHTTIRNWMEKDFPKLFKHMSADGEEAFKGTGGLRDPYGDGVKAAAARGQLKAVREVAKSISDPMVRGELIQCLRDTLRDLEDGGEYEIDDADF